MAQFVAFNSKVEVNRRTVLAIVNSIAFGREIRAAILLRNGIDVSQGMWYSQQKWLNAFREISGTLGELHLYLIGNAIIDNAEFPPMKGLEDALSSIDIAYHMNHRLNGKIMYDEKAKKFTEGIGNYRLTEFDAKARKAVMNCNNPYPSKFDEGIIAQVVYRFRPEGARERVELDHRKESRLRNGDSCTYLISW